MHYIATTIIIYNHDCNYECITKHAYKRELYYININNTQLHIQIIHDT